MAKRKDSKQLEKAGRKVGQLVGRLEREARSLRKRSKQVRAAGRKGSIQLLRRSARALSQLALEIEKAGRGPRRRAGRKAR